MAESLASYLARRREEREILLMTHIVLGYPSLDASLHTVEAMVRAGVDLMELQIPFSEPIADGPVILRANQRALAAGTTVEECLEFAWQVTRRFPIPFLFMTYYNVPFRRGPARFAQAMAECGVRGAIVPDLPPEEGQEYLEALAARHLDPVFIFAPTTSDDRMAYLAERARGFIYCVARKGVTGSDTKFSAPLSEYLSRCRRATALPLAVGFGVKDRDDVSFLRGRADIAVVGSQTIRVMEDEGIEAVGPFLRGLR